MGTSSIVVEEDDEEEIFVQKTVELELETDKKDEMTVIVRAMAIDKCVLEKNVKLDSFFWKINCTRLTSYEINVYKINARWN